MKTSRALVFGLIIVGLSLGSNRAGGVTQAPPALQSVVIQDISYNYGARRMVPRENSGCPSTSETIYWVDDEAIKYVRLTPEQKVDGYKASLALDAFYGQAIIAKFYSDLRRLGAKVETQVRPVPDPSGGGTIGGQPPFADVQLGGARYTVEFVNAGGGVPYGLYLQFCKQTR